MLVCIIPTSGPKDTKCDRDNTFHGVLDFGRNEWDAVERVLTMPGSSVEAAFDQFAVAGFLDGVGETGWAATAATVAAIRAGLVQGRAAS